MENNITVIKKIRIGSTAFFNSFSDFKSKDIDELCIISSPINNKKTGYCLKAHKKDIILYPELTKEEFIDADLKVNDALKIGKYLVPEFAEYIGLTIEDLYKLKPLVDKLDKRHIYEKSIYDSYINNNSFILTNEQLDTVYQIYKNNKND